MNRFAIEFEGRINLKLLEHVSPIGWDNVLLYGRICAQQEFGEMIKS